MKIPRSQLAGVLATKTLGTKRPLAKHFSQEIAAYLIDTNRELELDSLLRDMMDYRANAGVIEVRVVAAHPLTEAAITALKAYVAQQFPEASDVIVIAVHDSSVIGGVRLEFPNQQLDMSVREKLRRLTTLTATERN